MKKVLTVLAILVVLTSAVFAAETHKIKVTASVAEALPIFQLKYEKNNTSIVTNTTAKFDATKTGTNTPDYKVDSPAIDGGDISTAAIAGTVVASIAEDVKLKTATTYHLTFKANPLVGAVSKHEVLPTAEDSGIAKASGIDDNIGMENTASVAVAGKILSGTIDAAMSVNNITACDLAEFTFNYDADPTAPADTYAAYIELEITVG